MSETPELVVYETFIAGDGHPGLRTRDATVPEVVAWLREQGAIDYQTAALEFLRQKLRHDSEGEDYRPDLVVDAALRVEGEEE